jgi:predicted DNA-binding protein
LSRRAGRPQAEDPKRNKIEIRLSDEELDRLLYCCRVTQKTKSGIIRDGIDEIYAKLKLLYRK